MSPRPALTRPASPPAATAPPRHRQPQRRSGAGGGGGGGGGTRGAALCAARRGAAAQPPDRGPGARCTFRPHEEEVKAAAARLPPSAGGGRGRKGRPERVGGWGRGIEARRGCPELPVRPRRRRVARGERSRRGASAEVEGTKCEVRSRVSRFLAWGSGWRAACFPLPRGWGSGTREGRERGGDAWGSAALPGKGFRPRETPLRVGPVGSLVLRPKPSPIGLASPIPEGTGRAGTRGFSLTERGL